MNRDYIKELDKYTEIGGSIKLKREVSELNNWYELEEILHEAHEQSGGDDDQWKKLTERGRDFDCFMREVESTIKNLGGKLYKDREHREREQNWDWGCEICGKLGVIYNIAGNNRIEIPFDVLVIASLNSRELSDDIEIKTKSGKSLIKKQGEKFIACEDCTSYSPNLDVMIINHDYKYRCKKCWFKGECSHNTNKSEIGKEHLNNSPSCSGKNEKNGEDFRGKEIIDKDEEFGNCEDWEINKKILKNKAVYYFAPNLGDLSKIKYYDRDKKEISYSGYTQKYGEFSATNCSKCNEFVYKRNSLGDEWIMEGHEKNKNGEIIHLSSNNNFQKNKYLAVLRNVKAFVIANNVKSITNQNNNIVIVFNTNTTSQPQIIDLSDELLETEQRTMWQNFNDYLKKINKNGLTEVELENEIKKLENNSEQKPQEKPVWPWVVGGIGIVTVISLILIFTRKKSKKK